MDAKTLKENELIFHVGPNFRLSCKFWEYSPISQIPIMKNLEYFFILFKGTNPKTNLTKRDVLIRCVFFEQ